MDGTSTINGRHPQSLVLQKQRSFDDKFFRRIVISTEAEKSLNSASKKCFKDFSVPLRYSRKDEQILNLSLVALLGDLNAMALIPKLRDRLRGKDDWEN
ncbi:hypothetical protein [Pedobacter endophyticus]|uniref:Uncharacterized protein n=1 Tax=Pedobacter endophyticus TaxID=2789740 RepID=A0A7S9Q0L1_9SPHI|nr:hypothetical protein [Pedobacter endophyticus]QPH41718.1 hypothetical protein IZT61_10880 [Pedobacter endophyticus]